MSDGNICSDDKKYGGFGAAMAILWQRIALRPHVPWGVVRFGRVREGRHCLLGCIFWAKFGRWGGLRPWPNRDGRTELNRLSHSKKSTIPQSTIGGSFMFGESAVGWNGGPVCGDGN